MLSFKLRSTRPLKASPGTQKSLKRSCGRFVTTHAVQVDKGWWRPKPTPTGPVDLSTYVTEEARNTAFTKTQEQAQPLSADVLGTLPAWVQGSVLLNGCGDYTGMRHLFDGYASIVRVHMEQGKATASYRFVESRAYKAFKSTGRLQFSEFATPATKAPNEKLNELFSMVQKMATNEPGAMTDNASVTLIGPVGDGNEVLALTESKEGTYRIDATTLETKEHVHYNDGIGGMLQCAHAKQRADGTLVNFVSSLPYGSFTVYVQDPVTLKRRVVGKVPHRDPWAPVLIHEFVVTENFAVLVEPPYFFSLGAMMGEHDADCIIADWKPREGTRVHVVPLDGSGKVKTYSAPPFFTFHQANAFESSDGRYLYLDLSVYDDAEIVNDLRLDRLRKFPGADIVRSYLRRLTIPLSGEQSAAGLYGDLQPELLIPPQPLLDDESVTGFLCEFPVTSPTVLTKKHRYVYGTCARRPTNVGNCLAKWDVDSRTCKVWHEAGTYPSGPMFIPRPGGEAEDDGLVASMLVAADGSSQLLLLNGSTFEEVARVALPFKVSNRFHGLWMPKQ